MTETGELIRKLADQIVRYKNAYYAGRPLISDADFDALEDQLRALAPSHPALLQVGPEIVLGKKVRHAVPMLSLEKTYERSDLLKWVDHRPIVGTWKLDGNSMSLVFENGRIQVGKTRGDGRVGEEVTEKLRWVADLSNGIDFKDSIEIRGELFCTLGDFAALAEEMQQLGLEVPTNPRNIVAGLLGRKGYPELGRYFQFCAFDVLDSENVLKLKTEIDKFNWLKSQGLITPHYKYIETESELDAFLNEVKAFIDDGDIAIDGAVFTLNELHLHAELGATSHHPRYKLSFKWPGQTAITMIKEIFWDTSRLGRVTPVAVVEAVNLSGAQITNVTLHNALHVMTHHLKPGDTIEIIRSGEVIPKFLSVKDSIPGEAQLIKDCPSCSHPLTFDGVRLLCTNVNSCPAQQQRKILNWIRAVEIEDISDKRLENMADLNLVRTISDLYKLKLEDVLKLPATKEKMAQKMLGNIAKSKNVALPRFLYGLGIEGGGLTTWEKICEYHPSLADLQALTVDHLCSIDGFAQKSALQLLTGLQENAELIKELLSVGVTPHYEQNVTRRDDHPLSGKSIAITGALSRPRSVIETALKQIGASPASAVTKNTFALVTNETESGSSKMKKAKELGIPIWDEEKLMLTISNTIW